MISFFFVCRDVPWRNGRRDVARRVSTENCRMQFCVFIVESLCL